MRYCQSVILKIWAVIKLHHLGSYSPKSKPFYPDAGPTMAALPGPLAEVRASRRRLSALN